MRKILRINQVMKKTGLKKSTIYHLIKHGKFPKQRKITQGGRAVGWYEDEIEEYLKRVGG